MSKEVFNGINEKERKGEASPNNIYPQQLLTLENFLKKIYHLT